MLTGILVVLLTIGLFSSYVGDSYAESCDSLAKAGDRVGIKFQVTNYHVDEPIAAIVVIKDSNDVTLQLSWLLLVLEPDQKMDVIQSWVPEDIGKYTAEVFVWYDIDNPEPLGSVQELTINVNC